MVLVGRLEPRCVCVCVCVRASSVISVLYIYQRVTKVKLYGTIMKPILLVLYVISMFADYMPLL